MSGEPNYDSWTKTSLIQRLRELESQVKKHQEAPAPPSEDVSNDDAAAAPGRGARKAKAKRKMDPSRHASRFIALKLAYLGKNYGGFEFQATGNQPSIEEELWKALTKACLIFPEDERAVQFDCCEYSKCGRTDRGVSAFGQVIGLRVRSNRPPPETENAEGQEGGEEEELGQEAHEEGNGRAADEPPFDDLRDELCYPRILNRLLPNDIRILAWCPSPPADFSARFSCRERQYRYFFTQPAFAPTPSSQETSGLETGWLDIAAMRDAAKRFEGDQDFRNFCKIDPGKQITNFRRHIFEADIVQVASDADPDDDLLACRLPKPGFAPANLPGGSGPFPKTYYFHVRGSAFLWHQIRHMVAVLFLVGQRLEPPSIVTELLDTARNPGRPSYNMADEVPLVLWDCLFPDLTKGESDERTDALDWIYVGEEHALNKFGQFGVMESLWKLWRGHKMDELLSSQLLQLISQQGTPAQPAHKEASVATTSTGSGNSSARIFEGGNAGRLGGRYVRVVARERLQTPDEQNERYAQRKGFASAAAMRAAREEQQQAKSIDNP